MKQFATILTPLCLTILPACSTLSKVHEQTVVTKTVKLRPPASLLGECDKPEIGTIKTTRDLVEAYQSQVKARRACEIQHKSLIDWFDEPQSE